MIWFQLITAFILINWADSLISIGVNVDIVPGFSRSLPYVNLIRQARSWGSPEKPWDANCTFDPQIG